MTLATEQQVVERETATPIVIPATEVEAALQKMIDMVLAGQWCTGTMHNPNNQHCTLGMIELLDR